MDIPLETITDIMMAAVTGLIGILILLIRSLISEAKKLTEHLQKVENHLAIADLNIAKVLTVIAACKNCPHPDLKDIKIPELEE